MSKCRVLCEWDTTRQDIYFSLQSSLNGPAKALLRGLIHEETVFVDLEEVHIFSTASYIAYLCPSF